MEIHEVENLSAEELKSQGDEIVAALSEAEPKVLAARYVQARLDAKTRDEKLAEQGKTIQLLQERDQALQAELAESTQKCVLLNENLEAAKSLVAELKASFGSATDEATKNLKLARARRVALAQVAAVINPLLAEEG